MSDDNKPRGKKYIDHEYTREIVCPYCGFEHSDSWDYHLDETPTDIDCQNDDCGREFRAYADFDVTYISEKIEKDEESDVY